jgi:hypothetical protein
MSSFSNAIDASQGEGIEVNSVSAAAAAIGINDFYTETDGTSNVVALTLPYVSEAKGRTYHVYCIEATNSTTVNDAGDDTSQNTITLDGVKEAAMFYSDGKHWYSDLDA